MIEVGTLDRVTAMVGERGMGKSTLAWLDARSFRAETGGLIIGHSPKGQIGARPDITFHDSLAALARGVRRKPARMHFLTTGRVEPLIVWTQALAEAIKKRAWIRKNRWSLRSYNPNRPAPRGMLATPVLLVVDEGVAMKRHPSNEEMETLELFLTGARHGHVAFTWLVQAPSSRQWVIMEQANRFRIFRYTHAWGANAVRAAGVPQDVVAELPDLPRFTYYHLDKLTPETAGFRTVPKP